MFCIKIDTINHLTSCDKQHRVKPLQVSAGSLFDRIPYFDVRHSINIFLILAINILKIYYPRLLNAFLQISYLRSLKL